MRDVRIAILGARDLSRHGLKSIAEDHRLSVVATFTDWNTCERLLHKSQANVVLINDDIPPPQRIEEILDHLGRTNPTIAILVLTQRFVLRMLQMGVKGILHAHDYLEDLLDAAVKTVMRGELFVSSKVAADALRDIQVNDVLSAFEHSILNCMALRWNVQQMAHHLHVSDRTVYREQEALRRKLGVPSNQEIVAAAQQRGWLAKLPIHR